MKRNNRPSPSESATLFDVDTRKKGNDGNDWIVVKTKQGVKKWAKALYSLEDADFLDDYLVEPDPKVGHYLRKYLCKARKSLLEVGVYLLFDKTCGPGWYCGSGSILSDLYDEHFPNDSDGEKHVLFGCTQQIIEDFIHKKLPTTFLLYHTLIGNSAKWKRFRENVKDILQTHFKVEWSGSQGKAIEIHIPESVTKKDYAYYKKLRKKYR
jgi:hypothetical protein